MFFFAISLSYSQNYYIADTGLHAALKVQFPNFFTNDSLIIDSAGQNTFYNAWGENNIILINSMWGIQDINDIKLFKNTKDLKIINTEATNADSIVYLDSLKTLHLFGNPLNRFPVFSQLSELENIAMSWCERRFPNFENNHKLRHLEIRPFANNDTLPSIDSMPIITYTNNIELLLIADGIKNFPLQDKLVNLKSLGLCCMINEIDLSLYINLDSLILLGSNRISYPINKDYIRDLSNNDWGLREIDVSNNIGLKFISLSFNYLEYINLSAQYQLEDIILYENLLDKVIYPADLSNLLRLYLFNNKIDILPYLGSSCNLIELLANNNYISLIPPICPTAPVCSLEFENNLIENVENLLYVNYSNVKNIELKLNKLDFSDAEEILYIDSVLYNKSLSESYIDFTFYPQKPFGKIDSFSFNQKIDTFISIKSQKYATSYQWYKDGVEIVGATDTILRFYRTQKTDVGKYECKSFGDTLSNLHFNNSTTEFISEPKYVFINNFHESSPQFHVYPNPTDNILKVELYTESELSEISIKLYDCVGSLVYSSVKNYVYRNKYMEILDVNFLRSGLYFLEFKENGKLKQTEKVLIIK